MSFGDRITASLYGVAASLLNQQAPAGRNAIYTANTAHPNAMPEPDIAIKGYWRKAVDSDAYYDTMRKFGFSQKIAWLYLIASQSRLSLADYITLERREEIELSDLYQYGNELSYSRDEIDLARKVTQYFPNPGDIVRFAVREVYSASIRNQYGMDEDITQEYIQEAKKAAMTDEQARNYWAAHWQLPSIGQGFEMFHRGVISADELNILLRSLDVMPYWRDKLTKISYNVLTRVDVRRMYRLGLIDEEAVFKNYTDSGYSPDDAERMTEFTMRYENEDLVGLTRSNLIEAYKDNLITRSELNEYLIKLGYSESTVELWLSIADYDKTLATIKMKKEDLIDRYKMGAINAETIRQELMGFDLPAQYVESVYNDIISRKSLREKTPSVETLEKWLKLEIIDELYYTQRMRLLGYTDQDIQLYLTELQIDNERPVRRYLTEAVYARWYKKGIMSEKDLTTVLREKNISEEDIERILFENIPE